MKIIQKLSQTLALSALTLFATLAHAQATGGDSGGGTGGTLGADISSLLTFIDQYVVPLIFAVAFLMFLWGVFNYFIAGGDSDEKRKEGRNFVIYAIIGFALMISIWGIVNAISASTGFNGQERPSLPTFGGGSTGTGDNNPPPFGGAGSGVDNGLQ